MLEQLTHKLENKAPLSQTEIAAAVAALVSEVPSAQIKAGFLSALAVKGETVDELAAFATELRTLSIAPPVSSTVRAAGILDVCGTGGDHQNTFNISTTVAILAASAGIFVAKHGNRAVTSSSGSADVLEALGIRVDLSPTQAAQSIERHHFAFLFAPNYHPAFKQIGPARRLCAERGQRTIFNFLGPVLNPATPAFQLVGVPKPELCEPIARVLQKLGILRGMVVSGSVGKDADASHMDEISTLGDTYVAEFYQDRGFNESTLPIESFPLQSASLSDLAGGDKHANARMLEQILKGTERGPKRDAVLLNAAAALFLSGATKSISEGWDFAIELIASGKAARKLDELRHARFE